jgi:hypothetical protein
MRHVQSGQSILRSRKRKEQLTMSVGLRNFWVQPDVHVMADVADDDANLLRRATLKVEGLLCSL